MKKVLLRAVALWTAVWMAPAAAAGTLPSGFSEQVIATGLANPTAMAFAPDGRLFVCLQGGQLRVVKNGVLLTAPFVSLTVNSSGERGLLGVTFDPDFDTNHFVYVYYTATTPAIHNRISRFTADGDVAAAGSETIILDLDDLSATNHNGGAIHFGLDGKLYAAVGDNANSGNAQVLTNLLGKMLRLNADGSIPADNPFLAQTTGRNQAIWALGLRNPFTFAVHPSSGRIFINDVGNATFEEINDGAAGANYGWPASEGPTETPGHQGPVYFYGHGIGPFTGCAITGGAFYAPGVVQFPSAYVGSYFFADICSGWINRLDPANGNAVTAFGSGLAAPVDLAVGPDGRLYYLARGADALVAISYTWTAPSVLQHPVNRTVAAGGIATFRVQAIGEELDYQWQRNGADIPGAISSAYVIGSAGPSDTGATFRCIVSNPGGSVVTAEAHLTVTDGPTPAIDMDGDGSLDLVWHHRGDGRVAVWMMSGTMLREGALLSPPQVSDTTWQLAGAGDLDGDGHADLVWQNVADGRISAWLMNGPSAREGTLLSIPQVPDTNWRIRAVGDLDGDGREDLFWQHQTTGQIAVWRMDGATVVQTGLLNPPAVGDLGWRIIGTADFNGDGRRDLVWHHQTDGRVAVWFMDGPSQISGSLTNPGQVADVNWKLRAVGDLNQDGHPDLFWQNVADGRVSVWLMNGLDVVAGPLLDPSTVTDPGWEIVGPG